MVGSCQPGTTTNPTKEAAMAARNTPALDLDTVLQDAREKITGALTAAREELADHEAKLAPLKENIARLEQALARLDDRPATRTRDRTDEDKARRRQRRAERRAARKVKEDAPAS
jgi:chromosome segregation ATPase